MIDFHRVRELGKFIAVIVIVALIAYFVYRDRNSTVELKGMSYSEMVSEYGAPLKTQGYPEKAAACTWILTGSNKRFRIGGVPSEENPTCGALWARFADGVVVDWGGNVEGAPLNSKKKQ